MASEHQQTTAPIKGIDVESVTAWFEHHVDGVVAPLRFTLIAGGRSNLTFKVEDAEGHAYALRRPPVSHVLPTAHDMRREHRLMTALRDTPVPVPVTLGLCEDPAVNGAPFFVMEFVEGHILRSAQEAEAVYDEDQRRQVGEDLARTLAALHRVDVDQVGLGDLARRDSYIERQLKRWSQQYRNSGVEGADPDPLVGEVGERLGKNIPPQRDTTIVHGDYRLDNVIVSDQAKVRAILDWEICTLGDPLADLGLLLVYWIERGDPESFLGIAATTAEGFPTRREMLDIYAESSGRDVTDVNFFMAFGYWKLACILQGVYVRYLAGAGAGDRGSVEEFPRQILRLAELAAEQLGATG